MLILVNKVVWASCGYQNCVAQEGILTRKEMMRLKRRLQSDENGIRCPLDNQGHSRSVINLEVLMGMRCLVVERKLECLPMVDRHQQMSCCFDRKGDEH